MAVLQNLRRIREGKDITQAELAAKADVAEATIVRLEKGQDARISTIRKLAAALEVDSAELKGLEPAATPAAR